MKYAPVDRVTQYRHGGNNNWQDYAKKVAS